MEGDFKFVQYEKYCSRCEHYDEDEGDPKSRCYDCLENPVNVDSHKPINFKEKD